ncbi:MULTISPECIES: DUF4238 domain-containing protein [Parasphingorhabdus]|uniref:DUF4238 domain-containing protein n=1 Tax=Parasphingorhabdus halotolerans TaxID=2725558 RepID=A0A6H2DQT1_9SPHN|nr:DUF4238 domain-containing protein [Parasphingorhabdus halotolerans]QJB70315.1 DUF4238 domain-containing protein [Parasphingorhabdus halotolerans]
MTAQHQHYVPKLLLRGFLSKDRKRAAKEQVHVLDLNEQRSFPTSIDNIMGERRFNDFWVDEDILATIEPWTSQIEAQLAPIVERIRIEKTLERTQEEIGSLASLIAFQFIRTKGMRLMPERLDQQMRSHVRRMGFDPAKVDGLMNLDEEGLKTEHVRHQIQHLGKYAEIIAEKEFFLMAAPEGRSFYIGDHPVVLHNDEPRTVYRGHLGIGAAYIQIYLPISSDVLLCAYDKAVLGQMMKTSDESFNKEVASYALGKLRAGEITAEQMKSALELRRDLDPVNAMIRRIRAGQSIAVDPEQVQCYNSMQAFFAHRFVIDPDDDFSVAKEMIEEREAAAHRERDVG